jgi:hypothetical protein
MGAPGRDTPQMTQLHGKLSATTPEDNGIDRLDRAAHPAGTNRIHKKGKSMKPKACYSARYGHAAAVLAA